LVPAGHVDEAPAVLIAVGGFPSPGSAGSRRTVPASERDLAPTEIVVRLDQPLAAVVEHLERAIVPWAMRSAGGHVELAAKMLSLSRKGLYLKRQRLGLDAADTVTAAGGDDRA
jgi:DNA-binding NtrC family response regulator